MKIDKENEMVIFDKLSEIKCVAWALRHCHKQAADTDPDIGGEDGEFCYKTYDALFDAFIRNKPHGDSA